jgi:hypothetical protein
MDFRDQNVEQKAWEIPRINRELFNMAQTEGKLQVACS